MDQSDGHSCSLLHGPDQKECPLTTLGVGAVQSGVSRSDWLCLSGTNYDVKVLRHLLTLRVAGNMSNLSSAIMTLHFPDELSARCVLFIWRSLFTLQIPPNLSKNFFLFCINGTQRECALCALICQYELSAFFLLCGCSCLDRACAAAEVICSDIVLPWYDSKCEVIVL